MLVVCEWVRRWVRRWARRWVRRRLGMGRGALTSPHILPTVAIVSTG